MAKIIIVGGSSEIANAISQELVEKHPSHFTQTIRISTTLENDGSIPWNPMELTGIKEGVEQIELSEGDCVIISLGALGDINEFSSPIDKMQNADLLYKVNFLIPALTLTYFSFGLESVGGGNILLLTSTAAFPVLNSNFIYGSSKSALDSLGRYLQKDESLQKTKISIVRSGFVRTKLNSNRNPTPFSQTAQQVAKQVARKMNRRVIWTPNIFRFISLVLVYFKPLRIVANKFFDKSKL
jgi:short-subunit dehydrogenase